METFEDFLATMDEPEKRQRLEEIFAWVEKEFPQLKRRIAWNQPMYTDHGTYIIGFSTSKKHIAVGPENAPIKRFANEIEEAGYEYTNQIIRYPWNKEVNYSLLKQIIEFNILDKADHTRFWR